MKVKIIDLLLRLILATGIVSLVWTFILGILWIIEHYFVQFGLFLLVIIPIIILTIKLKGDL